jgi:hypothetical protein
LDPGFVLGRRIQYRIKERPDGEEKKNSEFYPDELDVGAWKPSRKKAKQLFYWLK